MTYGITNDAGRIRPLEHMADLLHDTYHKSTQREDSWFSAHANLIVAAEDLESLKCTNWRTYIERGSHALRFKCQHDGVKTFFCYSAVLLDPLREVFKDPRSLSRDEHAELCHYLESPDVLCFQRGNWPTCVLAHELDSRGVKLCFSTYRITHVMPVYQSHDCGMDDLWRMDHVYDTLDTRQKSYIRRLLELYWKWANCRRAGQYGRNYKVECASFCPYRA